MEMHFIFRLKLLTNFISFMHACNAMCYEQATGTVKLTAIISYIKDGQFLTESATN